MIIVFLRLYLEKIIRKFGLTFVFIYLFKSPFLSVASFHSGLISLGDLDFTHLFHFFSLCNTKLTSWLHLTLLGPPYRSKTTTRLLSSCRTFFADSLFISWCVARLLDRKCVGSSFAVFALCGCLCYCVYQERFVQ